MQVVDSEAYGVPTAMHVFSDLRTSSAAQCRFIPLLFNAERARDEVVVFVDST